MPLTPTYPGVYVEELPSSVHTITGASTSNTAFIDFFERGPVKKAVRITSYTDFVRYFGGLDARSEASYGIMQYYLNGGSTGYVIRVVPKTAAVAAVELQKANLVIPSSVDLSAGGQARFSATTEDCVTFSLLKSDGSAAIPDSDGVIDSKTGQYTAPRSIAADKTVSVKATCAGNCGKPVANATISLKAAKIRSVTPAQSTAGPGQTIQVSVTTVGLADTRISWSCVGGGTIDRNGLYTAPNPIAAAGDVTITATSMVVPTVTATAKVSLDPKGAVVPDSASVDEGKSVWLSAFMEAAADKGTIVSYEWFLGTVSLGKTPVNRFCLYTLRDEVKTVTANGANGKAMLSLTCKATTDGVAVPAATPAAAPAPFTTDATPAATVTVNLTGAVSVSPRPSSLKLLAKQQFSATTVGVSDNTIVWTISGDKGSASSWGTLDSASGLYQAPDIMPPVGTNITITATNQDGSGVPGTVTFTITAPSSRLRVSASSEGAWGNQLRVVVLKGPKNSKDYIFGLQVDELAADGITVVNSESYGTLSTRPADTNYCVSVLAESSSLIRMEDFGEPYDLPFFAPAATATSFMPLSGGTDGAWDGSEFTNALVEMVTDESSPLSYLAPDFFNILCIPAAAEMDPGAMGAVYAAAGVYCAVKRAFLIVDIPSSEKVRTPQLMADWLDNNLQFYNKDCSAVYYPRLQLADPLNNYRLREVGSSGTLAGVYAATDAARGIWKAPAGTQAVVSGATPAYVMKDADNGLLNPRGINAIRSFPVYGVLSWGARTLRGADALADQWKYIPVRRVAQYIENSLFTGLTWAVFEPNDTPLWGAIVANVTAFMNDLFRQGAFQGSSPTEAYFVRCDKTTTTQFDIDRGRVNVVVGFAPLKPAEFVIVQIQQIAGQTAS